MGVGGQPHAPTTSTPGKTRYIIYRRLDGPRASLDGRKISSPSGYFLVHQYLLPYNSYIPVHTLFNLPSTAGQSRSFVLSVTTSQFYHLPPLPTLRHLKLFCHCRYTLRSLLLVIPVYLMLHGHLNSPQTLVMEDVLTSPTCPNLCRRGGGGFQYCL